MNKKLKKLSVNVDHVATIREARKTIEPDPVEAAVLALVAGADGITIHLREDRRHIQDRDLKIMREVVSAKLNLEMAATGEMIRIAENIKPDQGTLVPEKRQEITTEGGLDVYAGGKVIEDAVSRLKEAGLIVSLFIDPVKEQVDASVESGADYIEINTGRYSEARSQDVLEEEYGKICDVVKYARKKGLGVNAGHGLTCGNVGRIALLDEIEEFNIGHHIISRAVLVGMERAVKDMMMAINGTY